MSELIKLSKNSSFSIDCIRFLAAEIVVVGHGLWDFDYAKIYFKWFPLQDFAVLIFFILSGFLISYSLAIKINTKSYSFKEYFIDRFSRIYSALIPCLIIIAVLDFIFINFIGRNYEYSYNLNIKTFFGNALMLQDYPILLHLKYFLMASRNSIVYISTFGSGRPLWSLAVEWWMYMCFGWLLLRNHSNTKKSFYYIVLLLFSIVPIYNLFSGSKTEGLTVVWIMGCLVTILLNYNRQIKNINNGFLSIIFSIIGVITAVHFNSGYHILTALLFTFSFYFLILFTNKSTFKVPVFFHNIVKYGAGYSFTLYLLHYSILQYLLVFPSNYSPFARFCLYFLISNVLAFTIAQFTEVRYKQFSNYLKLKFIK